MIPINVFIEPNGSWRSSRFGWCRIAIPPFIIWIYWVEFWGAFRLSNWRWWGFHISAFWLFKIRAAGACSVKFLDFWSKHAITQTFENQLSTSSSTSNRHFKFISLLSTLSNGESVKSRARVDEYYKHFQEGHKDIEDKKEPWTLQNFNERLKRGKSERNV